MNVPYAKPRPNNDSTPIAFLHRDRNEYFFGLEGHQALTEFHIPTKSQVLSTCKLTSRKPPTIYIIFRKPVQVALRNLNFKFERTNVSRISSSLWRRIDRDLRLIFESLYEETARQWRQERIIFEFFQTLIE